MRPITWFVDIDGTLIKHEGCGLRGQLDSDITMLPGTHEFLDECQRRGDVVILATGRKENMRAETVAQLRRLNIFYDQLVMGCTPGPRVIINDGDFRAEGICVVRNQGLESCHGQISQIVERR